MSSSPSTGSQSLASLLHILLPSTTLSYPPLKPTHPNHTGPIPTLMLHPTLEAALHILNADLPSAHFLVRHMNAPPALEGMLLHGILHRIEGDYDNARAWLSDVGDACAGFVPKKREEGVRLDGSVRERCGLQGEDVEGGLVGYVYYKEEDRTGMKLVDDVEAFRREGKEEKKKLMDGGRNQREEEIEERTRRELGRVVEWCRRKFGDGKWEDASEAWARPGEEVRKMGNDQVSEGKGLREF